MKLLNKKPGKITPKILAEQTEFCFDVFPVTGSMHVIAVIVIGFLVWTEVDRFDAGYWFSAALLIIFARFALYYFYKSFADRFLSPTWWYRMFLLGAFASAVLMCFAGLVFFPDFMLTSQMVFTLLTIGIVSGALPVLATDLKFYIVYVGLNIIPIALVNMANEQIAIKLVGALTFVFIGMLMLSGYLFSRTLFDSLVYRYRSELLAERLQVANNRLSSANQELQEISTTDELTGTFNRRYFNQRFEEVWADHLREGHMLSAVMIDVDYFKIYNDNFGHLQGDYCLKRLAQEIMEVICRPRDFVARFGGEEFIILLPNTDLEGAKEICARIHNRVAQLAIPHKRTDNIRRVTVSIGGAVVLPTQDFSTDQFLQKVDRALYQAKRSGRNTTVFA